MWIGTKMSSTGRRHLPAGSRFGKFLRIGRSAPSSQGKSVDLTIKKNRIYLHAGQKNFTFPELLFFF